MSSRMGTMVRSFRDLRVYRKAFIIAREIYEITKTWPKEEQYAMSDQIRRSSRSVCANLAEAWRRRQYPKHFVSKLSDCTSEAAETRCWLDFAVDCKYISRSEYERLDATYDEIQGGLTNMLAHSHKWCAPSRREASK